MVINIFYAFVLAYLIIFPLFCEPGVRRVHCTTAHAWCKHVHILNSLKLFTNTRSEVGHETCFSWLCDGNFFLICKNNAIKNGGKCKNSFETMKIKSWFNVYFCGIGSYLRQQICQVWCSSLPRSSWVRLSRPSFTPSTSWYARNDF